MEFSTQIINISKIKEGFYIGDRATGLNLDLIIQFKITHMINASGNRLINAFETIGIKYLTLHWAESSNQSLFDPKDNIADVIVSFIDDALKNGEGLLAHSVRGLNRVCIVVIIYLMKKYNWGLMKCIDFLHSKKADVDIPKYFLTQLSQFESRLGKNGCCPPQSLDWNDDGNIKDNDEKVMRNTYVNGLLRKENNNNINAPSYYQSGKRRERNKIGWGDCNPFNRNDTLIHPNIKQDLFIRRDIKPVVNHLRLLPGRSCLKKSKSNQNNGRNINSNNNTNNETPSLLKIQEANRNSMNNLLIQSPFNRNVSPLQKTNSFTPNDSDKNAPKDKLYYFNHHFCSDDSNASHTFDKRNNSYTNNKKNILKDLMNNEEKSDEVVNHSSDKNHRMLIVNSNNKKRANHFFVKDNSDSSYQLAKKDKKNKSIPLHEDNQLLMKNNFIVEDYTSFPKGDYQHKENNSINTNDNNIKLLKVRDSGSLNNPQMLRPYNNSITQKKNQIVLPPGLNSNYQPQIMKMRDENHKNPMFFISNNSINNNKPLNNFDPSLMRKNQNMFNRPRSGTNNQTPITLSKDIIKKSMTPDYTLYHSIKQKETQLQPYNNNNNYLYSSIQRSTQQKMNKDINDPMLLRPSTAPQKDKHYQKIKQYQGGNSNINKNNTINNNHNSNSYIKNPSYPGLVRLPSPMSKSQITYDSRNYLPNNQQHQPKYRAPSPMIQSTTFGQRFNNNFSLIK